MALLPILLHPDPRLRQRAEPVADVTPEVAALAQDMLETMKAVRGIGLAAPQIGAMQRLIVMGRGKGGRGLESPIIMVNPIVVWASAKRVVQVEGCLSIPDRSGPVQRPADVVVAWTSLEGQELEARFTGLLAACVQHEIDHLNGRLFIDRIVASPGFKAGLNRR